jgi:RNA polymerase sigma-70 factor, ECF subfamily
LDPTSWNWGDDDVEMRQEKRATRASRARRDDRKSTALEREAIASAKAGDWDALHFLYVRYADDVKRFVQSIVHDSHEAEDITQDVFAKLMRAIKKYEERDVPFAAWILRVARNAALDNVRARRQVPVEQVRTSDEGLDQAVHERAKSLREALASLPQAQRQVLILRHVAGLSPNEIAERLGKTESSVQGLHHRGRAAIKVALSERGAAPVTAS